VNARNVIRQPSRFGKIFGEFIYESVKGKKIVPTKTANKIGFIASLLVAGEVLTFAISLLPGFWGIDLINLSFVASFLLAPTFITVMTCVHYSAPEEKKIWSHLGLVFSTVYAVMVMITYYTQLVVVRTNSLGLSPESLKLFTFTPGSLMFALDMLGYGFMCLATLLAAPVFYGSKLDNWIRRLFIVNGLFFIPSLVFPAFTFPQDSGSVEATSLSGVIGYLFWCTLFVSISMLLAKKFVQLDRDRNGA
jgi:hypothetical protein